MRENKHRWWKVLGLVLAANCVLFGVLFTAADRVIWAIATGFVPAVLISAGVLATRWHRATATALVTIGVILAGIVFWAIYPIVLGVLVVAWGVQLGELAYQVGAKHP